MSKTETKDIQKREEGPMAKIKSYLANVDVQSRLEAVLGERAGAFSNSIINVVSSSKQLKAIAASNPSSIMKAAMKAATLNLFIEPALGWAAIVPYKNEAVFQIMYRGIIQLCIRSGQYKTINCTEIYADEIELYNPITGEVAFKDPKTYKMRYQDDRDKHIVGHYIYFKLLTGFEHSGYISHKEALAHAKKYSKAYQYDLSQKKATSAWSTHPIPMGNKTLIIRELKRYGVMSIDMQDAMVSDRETFEEAQENATKRIEAEQGSEPIDAAFEENGERDAETQAKIDQQIADLGVGDKKANAAAAKKAKDELDARSKRQTKKKAKSKDQLPKFYCPDCKRSLEGEEIRVKDSGEIQCPKCLNLNVETPNSPEPDGEVDPDIHEKNN